MKNIKLLFLTFFIFTCVAKAQENRHFEFTLNSPVFTQGTPNLAVNIQFPNVSVWGWIEVTITSSYNGELSTGKLTKRYNIGHNVASMGGFFSQTTEIPEALGTVAAQWHIGDFNHENNNITIYHLVNSANTLTIKVEGVMSFTNDINLLKTGTTISPLFTLASPGNRHYMSIMQDRVGIGTNTPDTTLAVNGTIHSKEVKVDINGWPDYVFKKDYNLPTLEEVEEHINAKGYLENIPSEEEVLKNGIHLGEMNANLLQKIEELTLYMIHINKKVKELQINNTKLIEENKVLIRKVEDLGNRK